MLAVTPRRRVCTATFSAVFAAVLASAAFSQTPSENTPLSADGSSPGYALLAAPQPPSPTANDDLPAPLRRQIVSYQGDEPPGTVIVDTGHTFLYLTLGGGKALRYGIGVGRKGFTWSGVEKISRKLEWPDWVPPAEMIARQPYLPRWVSGGPGNPLGARALYLGNTDYRIHGTNNPASIGKHVSSGCIRMRDADIVDLYERVGVGTKVVVLPADQQSAALGEQTDVPGPRRPAGVVNAKVPTRPVVITPVNMPRAGHQVEQ